MTITIGPHYILEMMVLTGLKAIIPGIISGGNPIFIFRSQQKGSEN
jgi:hypothetical protein